MPFKWYFEKSYLTPMSYLNVFGKAKGQEIRAIGFFG